MLRVVLRIADDTGLVPYRHAHGLSLVELRILECSQTNQSVGQCLWQLRLLKIDQVGQCHGQRLGHLPGQLLGRRALPLPGCGQVFIVDEGDVQRMDATRGTQDGRLNIVCRHGLDRRQESPLIWIRSQFSVDKHAATTFARRLLQRQGDQVAEAACGHRVLVREQAVVGLQLKLPSA